MRDKWYADNRDLVKWGVVLSLAERFNARHILQVLYYRPCTWPTLEIDGEPVALPEAVLQHFRNASAVRTLKASVSIDVVTDVVVNRTDYLRTVLSTIRNRPATPGIVFLDPDTGLQPVKPSLEHVLDQELVEVWAGLVPGDLLVFYQHQTNRNGQPWVEPKKQQFEQVLSLPIGSAKLARAESIARDVVFFYVEKTG